MKALIFIVISVFFLSCSGEKEGQFHYTAEKHRVVMFDLTIAEAALKDIDVAIKDSLIGVYQGQIANLHKVDWQLFTEDMEIIQNNSKLYKEYQALVADSLAVMEKEWKDEAKPKIESLSGSN